MAVARRGPSALLMDAYMDGGLAPVLSQPLLDEVRAVLSLPWVKRKYGTTPNDVSELCDYLRHNSWWVTLSGGYSLCRDPEDDMVIETAIRGGARVIVSRDGDLLDASLAEALRALRIRVLRPEEFLALLGADTAPPGAGRGTL